ncbi:hypothetical protein OV450_0142 [Actinobacteria bacterium OV450]|nr:hypothetical protein OV450_0142 [Actinobacteria bacterium OV450]
MEDQGGAGGAPLHGHDDEQRRRAPHVAPPTARTGAEGRDREPVRREDTDEASRLDRPDEMSRDETAHEAPGPVRKAPRR